MPNAVIASASEAIQLAQGSWIASSLALLAMTNSGVNDELRANQYPLDDINASSNIEL